MSTSGGSYVLAMGTGLKSPQTAFAALAAIAPDAELRARKAEEWHYETFRPPPAPTDVPVRFVEPEFDDSMQAMLFAAVEAEDRDTRRLLDELGPHSSPIVETLAVILVVLGAVGTGAGNEAGKDLYAQLKRRLKGPARSPSEPELQTGLERLFKELGLVYRAEHGRSGPVFLRVKDPLVTFLVEPDLPDHAVRQAARIVLGDHVPPRPQPAFPDWPLRFSRSSDRWQAMPQDWKQVHSLRALGRELDEW